MLEVRWELPNREEHLNPKNYAQTKNVSWWKIAFPKIPAWRGHHDFKILRIPG